MQFNRFPYINENSYEGIANESYFESNQVKINPMYRN